MDSLDSMIEFSPGGKTKYYTPQCDTSLNPYVGQKFQALADGINFYKKYALACGFDIRLATERKSSDGTCVKFKYVLCNREGMKNASPNNDDDDDGDGVMKRRRTVSKRVDCKARIVFKFIGNNGYIVHKFIERHTHTMIPDSYKHFMRMNTVLDDGYKKFIMNCAKANIGAMKSYRLLKELSGNYSSIGCSKNQVRNFSRDLKAYVLGVDAQMVIDKLHKKRELCPAFVFEYKVDEHDHLTHLFWADPVSRQNYCAFGDVISFDATYETNRYNMIFAPFTGKDNHGRCVTLGATLMSGESIESYTWVFEQFKKCMGHGPRILMTDQDPAIKQAVERVFVGTKHRLCMWHIMMKLPDKAPAHLKKDSSFLKTFCSLVWSVYIEPSDFEARWMQTMVDFGVTETDDDKWFKYMFEIRENWIPAYFRDFPMGGLFRTTSPSESENSFFRSNMNSGANLLEFFMYFDSALDSQRHTQAKLNFEDMTCCRDFKTSMKFERHAAEVYTRSIFNEVQQDIDSACYNCRLNNITDGENSCFYEVEERGEGFFNLTYDKVEKTVDCSCKKFLRIGLVCCHVFFIFKDLNFDTIPEKYIVSRWTKIALKNMSDMIGHDIEEACAGMQDNRLILHEAISEFYSCVGLAEDDNAKLITLLQAIRNLKAQMKPTEDHVSSDSTKKRLFEQYYNSTIPEEVSVKPPLPVKTKGSGKHIRGTRLKTMKETAVKESQKPMRKCSKCGKMAHHDARNCDKVQ